MGTKDDELSKILEQRKQIRRQERLARKAYGPSRGSQPNRERDAMTRPHRLQENLLQWLPSSLVPGNVGDYFDVAWPFDYTVQFNFGTNPTYGPATNVTSSFQVTQEAAFILGSVYRKCNSGTISGELSPLQMIVRDRQSTRQFMNTPIPIQAIAKKTPPTIFEIPMVLMPNAFVDVTLTAWNANPQFSPGDGLMTFVFSGYRTRTSDIGTVLSTIYGRG